MGSAMTATVLVVTGLVFLLLLVYFVSKASITRTRQRAAGDDDARAAVERLVQQTEQHAQNLLKQAERDAETLRKEAAVAAREKAHEIAAEAEREARERRQEILTLEQALADKTRALADRLTATDRLDQELRAREKALAASQQAL